MAISRSVLALELAVTHDIAEDAAMQALDVYAAQIDAPDGDLTDLDAEDIRQALAAQLAVDTLAPLDAVTEATEAKRLADEAAAGADREWRAAIRAALTAGQRVTDIADAAGISRERVYQIRDGRR